MNKTLKTRLVAFGSRPGVIILAVFLLGAAVYLPTLGYDFVLDDFLLVKNNPLIKSLRQGPQLLLTDFHISQYYTFYRPGVLLSFSLDHALYQDNPWGYHLTNTILHGLNAACLTFLAWLLFQNLYAAFAAGALFALHPAHPEATAWISGRTDLLFTFFSLLALLALVNRGGEKNKDLGPLLFSPLFFFCALLSKETAVVVLIPMAILLYQQNPLPQKRFYAAGLKILPHTLMLMLYLVLRYMAVKGSSLAMLKAKLPSSPLFLFELGRNYIIFLLFPPQKAPYFHNFIRSPDPSAAYPFNVKVLIMMGISGVLLAAVIYLIYRRRETMPWFALVILPCMLSLYFSRVYSDNIMIERYLYLPTAGLALLAGWGLLQIPGRTKILSWLLLAVLLVSYGGAALWRAPLWQNELVLAQAWKKEYPGSPHIREFLGSTYHNLNRLAEAEAELSLAVALEPQHPSYRGSLGWVLLRRGKVAEARAQFAAALRLMPDYAVALLGMGKTYELEGNQVLAGEYYYKAKLADPQVGVFQR